MRTRRLATVIAVTAALLIGPLAGLALAHVHVDAPGATQGGSAQIAFGVPTEKEIPTVKVEIALPADTPILAVTVPAMEGWTSTLVTEPPAAPVTDASGAPVTEVVSRVVWTATGAGIAPEETGEFVIDAGVLPAVDRIVFKALQTYEDGSVVSWIQEEVDGAPEPDYPAPVLELGAAGEAAPAEAMAETHSDEAMTSMSAEPAAGAESSGAESSMAAASSAPVTSSDIAAVSTATPSSPATGISTSAAATTQASESTSSSNTGTVVIIVIVVLVVAAGAFFFVRSRRSTT